MRSFKQLFLVTAIGCAAMVAAPFASAGQRHHRDHNGRNDAALGVALVIGAAALISSQQNQRQRHYDIGYQPRYRSYGPSYGQSGYGGSAYAGGYRSSGYGGAAYGASPFASDDRIGVGYDSYVDDGYRQVRYQDRGYDAYPDQGAAYGDDAYCPDSDDQDYSGYDDSDYPYRDQ